MKKILSIILTVLMVSTLLVACGKKKSEGNALQNVKNSGKLTIGLDDSYPPMEFRDSKNNLVGFDIDLGKEIAKKLGVKAEFITSDFNGILLALNASKFNVIISGLSITDKRKETIDFSKPYIMGGQVIAVRSEETSIKSFKDLKGKVLACQLGSTGDKAASEIKELKEVKKYDKITEAFHELSSKRVDAVIMDAQVGGYYTTKSPGEYKILDGMEVKSLWALDLKRMIKN